MVKEMFTDIPTGLGSWLEGWRGEGSVEYNKILKYKKYNIIHLI